MTAVPDGRLGDAFDRRPAGTLPLARMFDLLGQADAGGQAVWLFAVSSLLALLGGLLPWVPTAPMLIVAIIDAMAAALIAALPWSRWSRSASLVVVPVALAVVAYVEWQIDTGAGTIAFLAMLFVWVGLHHRPGTALATTPLAITATLGPLLAETAGRDVLISTVGAIVVLAMAGEVVAALVKQLRGANQRLLQTDRWRTGLMASLAHDVRAPLAVIASSLDVLEHRRSQLDEATMARVLAAAQRQADHITGLASELLDADRVQRGALRLDVDTVAVTAALTRALEIASTTDVLVETADDLWVQADHGRLQQILVNLLTNAHRHGEPPIEVTCRREGNRVDITVRDHGPGLGHHQTPPRFVPYDPRSRANSVGLGLWLVQSLTEAHGGHLSYHDAGPGAAFTINLPATEPDHTT